MLKLAILGALGYAGYKYLAKNRTESGTSDNAVALAGGPLSDRATVQHEPPA